jgi:transcriptional regulator GlxA family with amidase domain
MTSNSAKIIVFVVFPGIKLLDLTGPLQVFVDANSECAAQYNVRIASKTGGDVASDAVLPVATKPLSELHHLDIDTLIIAGGPGAFAAAEDSAFLDHIRHLAAQSRRVASVCTGAFVLAQAGLLEGRSAVTHWGSCDRLRDICKTITVKDDAIFVRDGPVWTSAGVTAGIDMSLAMVGEDLGRKHALTLARSLVCYMVRPGGQSHFSTVLRQQSETASGLFDALDLWIASNLTATLSVEELAEQMKMSPRNFARLYKTHTGVSPAKAVERMRLDAACRLLEETVLPLTSVAKGCGFLDDERLRRAFARSLNIAPGEYRQRFGNSAPQS